MGCLTCESARFVPLRTLAKEQTGCRVLTPAWTADVAFACVDGAGRFLNMLALGVVMILAIRPIPSRSERGKDSRNGVHVKPDLGRELQSLDT